MNFIYLLISGFIIGICAVLPGISGTVIAIMIGIYDKVINILITKKNIKELVPLSIGLLLGIFLFGKIMYTLFNLYEIQIKYIFIGIILASIYSLNNEIIKKENKNLNIKYFLIAIITSLVMFFITNNLTNIESNISFIKLFIGGFLYISGKIVPGVSSSVFMMILGLYKYVLLFLSNPIIFLEKYYYELIPFSLGAVLGLVILIKVINYLLKNHFQKTYSLIIGLVFSSIIAIFPGFKLNSTYILSIIMMSFSFTITYLLSK